MIQSPAPSVTDSAAVRDYIIDALCLDLVGPGPDDARYHQERLSRAPSLWYLTGFLVPTDAPESQRAQDAEEELDEPTDPVEGSDDATTPERGTTKRVHFPSSMGLSVLVEEDCQSLDVTVSWGDYHPDKTDAVGAEGDGDDAAGRRYRYAGWTRVPREESLRVDLASLRNGEQASHDIPGSGGLQVVCLARTTQVRDASGQRAARALSVFVVNRRHPAGDDDLQDTAYAFQVALCVEADQPFIPRFDPRGLESRDWDERLADLHFHDTAEFAVGHNVSVRAEVTGDVCRQVHSEWMPRAAVERVEPRDITDVELSMESLDSLQDVKSARKSLMPLITAYRDWIDEQNQATQAFTGRRREVADELVSRAKGVAHRLEGGVDCLNDPDVLEAFRMANRAMARAARRREAQKPGVSSPSAAPPPQWRPFQLAYILMNLRGIAEPTHLEREFVDLLFFPTGGGKTEAYLGLAAFTLVLRRLRDPDPVHRGLSVLMRYTLRLLTLDQLGRAAALICALELERESNPGRLGSWPFEIALWVGRAATPNHMGKKGDPSKRTAIWKIRDYKKDSAREPPLPLEQCPWCATRFDKSSYHLHPDTNRPTNLHVYCASRSCDFSSRPLPIVAVDEPIYERLPAFMIATADKFAAMPWTGETARFFRGGDADNPRPPDLIIQDELHLISGPLGTMAGLYETAIDHLCQRRIGDKVVRPKIIASTATVRLAEKQIRALFGRSTVSVFPAPGLDRRDSFFAKQASREEVNPRLYLGIAAPGRGSKVIFLRCAITVMAAAQAAWDAASTSGRANPADPYMTVVAYFNALRELGSARRIVEDEINSRLRTYGKLRMRPDETPGLFANRTAALEPVELTSRVTTSEVADAKRRLALDFSNNERVDVALATNMISVGLDITRLGLMLVSGQPKTTAEYIQATSRVGRDADSPGLVITLLNVHKPRDRSHYEHFSAWHESFYRSVEATSVTPFSPRAMDRGLPAVAVALARLGIPGLNSNRDAGLVERYATETTALADAVGERARVHADGLPGDFGPHVRDRVQSLFDDWAKLADTVQQGGVSLHYTAERGKGDATRLLREMIDPDRGVISEDRFRFRSPRSLRDVEPGVLLGVKSPDGKDIK